MNGCRAKPVFCAHTAVALSVIMEEESYFLHSHTVVSNGTRKPLSAPHKH